MMCDKSVQESEKSWKSEKKCEKVLQNDPKMSDIIFLPAYAKPYLAYLKSKTSLFIL